MSWRLFGAVLGCAGTLLAMPLPSAMAQRGYPVVISPTGRPYGPTQAHYQYERQYGRPWWGDGGGHGHSHGHGHGHGYHPNVGGHIHVPVSPFFGYPAYYTGAPIASAGYFYQAQGFPLVGGGLPIFNGYVGANYYQQFGVGGLTQYPMGTYFNPNNYYGNGGSTINLGAAPPTFSWQQPNLNVPNGAAPNVGVPNAVAPGGIPANAGAGNWNGIAGQEPALRPGEVVPLGPAEPVLVKPRDYLEVKTSTPEQRQRSLHLQGQGDVWFRQRNYLQAYSRYKQAASAAADLAAPRFRMAYALLALQRYELAAPEFARGIRLDPTYPGKGEGPSAVFGEENRIASTALPQSVAAWVKQDIRSYDRLFVLGAFLLLEGDLDRSKTLLETAAQLGNSPEYVLQFLKARQAMAGSQNVPGVAPPSGPLPVPEAVEKVLQETGSGSGPQKAPKPVPAPPAPMPQTSGNDDPVGNNGTVVPSGLTDDEAASGEVEPIPTTGPVLGPALPPPPRETGTDPSPVNPSGGSAPKSQPAPSTTTPMGYVPIPKKQRA